jgi:hypothetical protein
VAGRHREALEPEFDPEEEPVKPAESQETESQETGPQEFVEPAAYQAPGAAAGKGRRPSRGALIVVAVVAVMVLVGSVEFALFGQGSGRPARSAPKVPRPVVVTTSERPTPVVYPTREEYVPPSPTVPSITRNPSPRPSPKATNPKTTNPTTPPVQHRAPCPVRLSFFHDWCIRHGYQPPQGG